MRHLKGNQQQQQQPTTESSNVIVIQDGQTPPVIPTNKTMTRVATLDVFRGLTIAVMILVDDAGGEWPQITHAPWNGCTLADFVMPFFLFIVGVAIALAFKRITEIAPAIKKVVARTLKLLFWGILLQGGYSHAPDDLSYGVNMKKIRWCGILQRIALAYLVVSLVEIATIKKRTTNLPPEHFAIFKLYIWNWLFGLCVILVYFATTYGLYVPDWHFVVHDEGSSDNGKSFTVKCGVRGHLGPPCNAVGYVDRRVWGINHVYHHPAWRRSKYCTESSPGEGPLRKDAPAWCWAPFEPEGMLSSISAILTSIIGVHYGHVLIHFEGHAQRLKHWVNMGFGFLILGIILHYTDAIPLNKQLYSFSYVCVTAGAAGLVFSAFYLLIDIWGLRRPFLLLEWMGMNAMLIFVMAAEGIFPAFVNGWYYDTPNNTLVAGKEHLVCRLKKALYGLTHAPRLCGYTDSNWTGYVDDRKSTSRYVFSLGTGAITWINKKQHVVTLSSTKAEYRGALKGACESVWLRRMLSDMQLHQREPTPMYCDNQGVMKLAKNPVFKERTKHVDTHWNYIRQLVEDGTIELQYCPTEDQIADIFTSLWVPKSM